MFKRKAFALIMLLFVLSILAGCGNSAKDSTASGNDVKSDKTKVSCGKDKKDCTANTSGSSMGENKSLCSKDDKNCKDSMAQMAMSSDIKASDNDFGGEIHTFKGWLFDQMSCGSKTPTTKTKNCLLMPQMEKSGYGVLVQLNNGNYKFYLFDAKGHQLAKDLLKKTSKTENITIAVTGHLNKAGNKIKIISLSEN